jgi:hypothetical protein
MLLTETLHKVYGSRGSSHWLHSVSRTILLMSSVDGEPVHHHLYGQLSNCGIPINTILTMDYILYVVGDSDTSDGLEFMFRKNRFCFVETSMFAEMQAQFPSTQVVGDDPFAYATKLAITDPLDAVAFKLHFS